MVISVASHRRSIRDAVLAGIPGDGLAAALSEATGSVSLFGIPAADSTKKVRNVLILMSDTGGGHRASAEALRDAFRLEYGDAYQVRPMTSFFLDSLLSQATSFLIVLLFLQNLNCSLARR
jgi:1,2-diacylglycerol 3-beta-galactosyltransferase